MAHSIYEVEAERDDQVEEEVEEDPAWSQFDDLAAAVLEDPETEQLLTAFQETSVQGRTKDAGKVSNRSRLLSCGQVHKAFQRRWRK